MHRVMKPIVVGVAALFGLGLMSAVAANRDAHGDAVRIAVMAAKSLTGDARGDKVSAVASANGEARSDAAKAKADADADEAAPEAEQDADQAAKGDRDGHGAAVSLVAKSDATAAHAKGKKKVNHGGAVSAAAHAGK